MVWLFIMLNEVNQMDEDIILKPIESFLKVIKGTEFEDRAFQMKKEIESEIYNYNYQLKADAAWEEYLLEED